LSNETNNNKEFKKISLDELCEDEKQKVTAELIARGLSAKQVMRGVGITEEQIERWMNDKKFKGMVENLIQGRLIKLEQAKIKADDTLLRGANVMGVLMGAIVNMTHKMSKKVSDMALDKEYEFSRSDPDTVFKLIGLLREIRSEVDNIQIRSLHLQSDGSNTTTNPMDANYSPKSSIRVMKIIEKINDLAKREGIPLDKARKIIMRDVEVIE